MKILKALAVAAAVALLSAPVAFAQSGDLAVEKTGPAEAPVDTDVTYTVTVTNVGADPVSTVTLDDNIPPGMTFVSASQTGGTPAFVCTNPGAGNNGLVSCTTATMLAGESATFTFVFHIAPFNPAGTEFTNIATVTTVPADANEENNSSTVTTVTPSGDIIVNKSGPAQANAGTDVSYTVTVTNVGGAAVSNVTLNDNIPPGMTLTSAAQTGGTPAYLCTDPGVGNTGLVSCTAASVPGGASATFTFVFHIDPMAAPGTEFTNVASVTTGPEDANEENNSAVAVTTTPPPPQSDLGVMKSGPAIAGPDTDVTYTIFVSNNGPSTSGSLTVSDTLPGTMTFVSLIQTGEPLNCTTPAVGAGGTITCTSPSFDSGDSTTLTLTGHIPSQTPGGTEFTNNVTVVTANDPNSENDVATTTLVVSDVDVSVTKTGPGTATAGTNLSYTITVDNAGPDTATNVALTDPLPSGTTFVSLTQNTGPLATCSTPTVGTNGTVNCGWTAIPGVVSAEFTLVINTGSATTIQNTAEVFTDSFDTDGGNNQSTVMTTVTQSADVTVTKSGPGTVTPGTNVSYTVTATNNGPSNAQNVSLTDTLPPNTTFVSATQNTGPLFNCTTGATINCTIATFNAGATATFTFVFAVAPGATGTLDNTANISTTTTDPVANNTSTTSATLTPSADAGITKSGPAAVTPGANASYTIAVVNNGPSDAQNVAWTDTLPANTTFVSLTQNSGPTFNCTTGPVINCSIATLTATTTANFTLVVAIAPATPNNSTVQNSATVSTTTTDPNGANTTSMTSATVGASADLTVTKTGPPTASTGQTISYAITLTNGGPSDAQNVVLTDNIPAQTTFNSFAQNTGPAFNCTTPAAGATGTVSCTLATMTAGTTATFTLVLNVNDNASTSITNSATATSSTAEAVPGNNTGSSGPSIVLGADLSISKTPGSGSFFAGEVVTFNIAVTNNGPDTANAVTVTDVLPAGTTHISSTPSQGTCMATTTVTCQLGTLTSGATATISLVVRLPETSGPYSNTATVTAVTFDPNATNNSSTATVNLGQGANIPALSPLMLLLCAASLGLAGWLVTRNT